MGTGARLGRSQAAPRPRRSSWAKKRPAPVGAARWGLRPGFSMDATHAPPLPPLPFLCFFLRLLSINIPGAEEEAEEEKRGTRRAGILEGARSRVKRKGKIQSRAAGTGDVATRNIRVNPPPHGHTAQAGGCAPVAFSRIALPQLARFFSGGGRRKGQEAVAAFTSEAVSRPHRIAWWWCSCSTRACPGSPHSGCSNPRATGRRQQLLAAAEDEEGSRHGGDHGHGTFLLWLASVLATHVLCVQKLIKLRVCSWKQNLVRCVPVLFTNRHVRACIDFCFLLFWWGLGRRK